MNRLFAISFDLDVAAAARHHRRRHQGAYKDIRKILNQHGFTRVQGSTHIADHEDQVRLFLLMTALQQQDWLGPSLKNIRIFRMESGADFTPIFQSRR